LVPGFTRYLFITGYAYTTHVYLVRRWFPAGWLRYRCLYCTTHALFSPLLGCSFPADCLPPPCVHWFCGLPLPHLHGYWIAGLLVVCCLHWLRLRWTTTGSCGTRLVRCPYTRFIPTVAFYSYTVHYVPGSLRLPAGLAHTHYPAHVSGSRLFSCLHTTRFARLRVTRFTQLDWFTTRLRYHHRFTLQFTTFVPLPRLRTVRRGSAAGLPLVPLHTLPFAYRYTCIRYITTCHPTTLTPIWFYTTHFTRWITLGSYPVLVLGLLRSPFGCLVTVYGSRA